MSARIRFVPIESRRFVTIDADAETLVGELPGFDVFVAPNVDGAIVKVRYTATQEQARRIDRAALVQALHEAGAVRVLVEPTIVREQRARVASMSDQLDEVQAFDLWAETQGLPVVERDGARALLTRYLEAAAS